MHPWLRIFVLKCLEMCSPSKHGRFGFRFIKIGLNLNILGLLQQMGVKIGAKIGGPSGNRPGLDGHPRLRLVSLGFAYFRTRMAFLGHFRSYKLTLTQIFIRKAPQHHHDRFKEAP